VSRWASRPTPPRHDCGGCGWAGAPARCTPARPSSTCGTARSPHVACGDRAVSSTVVHFATPTPDELDAYLGSGEPLHVAGAFTLDGLGAPFVRRVEGDPSGVVGLSLPLLRTQLARLGVPITDLWRR
jgi:hypothetical protein